MDFEGAMEGLKNILLMKGGGKQWNNPVDTGKAKAPKSLPYRLGPISQDEILEHAEEQKLVIMPSVNRQTRLGKDEGFWVGITGGPLRFEMSIVVASQWDHRIGQRALFEWRSQIGREVTVAARRADGYDMTLIAGKEDKRKVAKNGCWWFELDEACKNSLGSFMVAIF